MSIYQLINEVESGDIVLPAIQRDFVWDERRIYKLFDSLFRGYPIGIALLWETYQPIQFRKFEKNYNSSQVSLYEDNKNGRRIKLVLDGQQRLSSIFLALKGTFNANYLFFDVFSGREADDHSEVKFNFKFLSVTEAHDVNERSLVSQTAGKSYNGSYWMRLADLIGRTPRQLLEIRGSIAARVVNISEVDKARLEINLPNVNYSLCDSSELLKTQIIDSNLDIADERRKSPFDILEIFVRVNTSGISLKRSDLIISMLRLYWGEASDLLPRFIKEINQKNNLQIDNDFVIRCMFSVAGLGTRLEFDLLRRKSNVEALKSSSDTVFDSIRSCVDFVTSDCGIGSLKLLGGINSLVPFVHYLATVAEKTFSKQERLVAKRILYLFSFSKVFAQHVDSRPGAFIRDHLGHDGGLCFEPAAKYVYRRTGYYLPNEYFFGNHVELALSLLQRRTGAKTHLLVNSPEIDHIFPQSVLRDKGWDEAMINDIGNKWILLKRDNGSKGATAPGKWFEDIDDATLEAAFIDRKLLKYGSYKQFLLTRRSRMVTELQVLTKLLPDNFVFLDNVEVAPAADVEG